MTALGIHFCFFFLFRFKELVFHSSYQATVTSGLQRPCLFLSLPLPLPPTSYYSSSTPRPRSSAAALFHLRYSSALGPLQLKTDAITFPDRNRRGGDCSSTKGVLFSSRFFYIWTVRFGHQEQIVSTQEKQKCYRLNLSLNIFLSFLIVPSFLDRSKSKRCVEKRRRSRVPSLLAVPIIVTRPPLRRLLIIDICQFQVAFIF